MAKNVSTKFGDRRLVYLPPINIRPNKTPDVNTLCRVRPEQRRDDGMIVPKDYAYTNMAPPQRQNEIGNRFITIPQRSEGNLVLDNPSLQANPVSGQIFQQLIQQANTETMQGYSQGQYPVIQAPNNSPQYMQYTNYGLQAMQQQQQQQQGQIQPNQGQPVVQAGGQNNTYNSPNNMPAQHSCRECHDHKEKHIYHGPNGEILPGPPTQTFPPRWFAQDFAIEGLLRYGRLIAVNLFEASHGFPNIPEHLVRDLLMKYGQFEVTLVRIVSRGGHCYVHATPQFPVVHPERPVPIPFANAEYVPVYLDQDEEFDYDKFVADYRAGKYASGDPRSFRSFPPEKYRPQFPYRDPVIVDRPRTDLYDRKYNDQRYLPTRAWDTRQDIRPVESLRPNFYR